MVNILGHHLNKVIFASIPAIFKDEALHPCKLAGVEVSGLWLEGEQLEIALFPDLEKETPKKVFVPFAQIKCLVEDLGALAQSSSSPEPAAKLSPARQPTPAPEPARKRQR